MTSGSQCLIPVTQFNLYMFLMNLTYLFTLLGYFPHVLQSCIHTEPPTLTFNLTIPLFVYFCHLKIFLLFWGEMDGWDKAGELC